MYIGTFFQSLFQLPDRCGTIWLKYSYLQMIPMKWIAIGLTGRAEVGLYHTTYTCIY